MQKLVLTGLRKSRFCFCYLYHCLHSKNCVWQRRCQNDLFRFRHTPRHPVIHARSFAAIALSYRLIVVAKTHAFVTRRATWHSRWRAAKFCVKEWSTAVLFHQTVTCTECNGNTDTSIFHNIPQFFMARGHVHYATFDLSNVFCRKKTIYLWITRIMSWTHHHGTEQIMIYMCHPVEVGRYRPVGRSVRTKKKAHFTSKNHDTLLLSSPSFGSVMQNQLQTMNEWVPTINSSIRWLNTSSSVTNRHRTSAFVGVPILIRNHLTFTDSSSSSFVVSSRKSYS